MTDYISAELAATCDALGYYDGATYHLDSDALNVIKDLIKYLKRDDDTHVVRRYLGQAKLLETDLIRIFTQFKDNEELWDVLLRLMINLTSPALMVYNDILPNERINRNFYLQLVSHLQTYKKAFTDDRVWSVVSNRLGTILNIDYTERGEENELIIERILILIRNVLQVPPDDNDKRADNDATVHDELLFALHTSGIVNILLFIASNSTEQQFHMQIIEIIALMLREQNASKLATVGLQKSTAEKERDETKLLSIRRREITEKMEKMRKYTGARHSRFGGTFVVQNMKAIGENQLICHKPLQKIEALDFSHEKVKVKKPKNRVLIEPPTEERMSALSVRLFLKEFCMEFLIGAYNPVMRHAKSCIIGESNADKSDASHYLWAMRFFMEFNRYYKFQVKYVSETISTEIFYVVQRQMEQYYEMTTSDKKRTLYWSKRLHFALKAYQELLHTLSAMDKTTDKGVRDSSKVIKSNVFYVPEYRETILSQLLCYDRLKMSRSYLVDLLITVHLFLKMLEHFCAQGRSIIVAKTKKRRKKVDKSKKEKEQQLTLPTKSLDERWDEAGPELSAVMQEGTIPDVMPFDAASDVPIDEQKSDAMKRIQKLLRQKKFEEAIGLLRAARIVWPENDCFGKPDSPVEEEFLALHDIFFADLGVVEDEVEQQNEEDVEKFLNNKSVDEPDDDDESNEDEEAERQMQYEETNFVFDDFVRRFANVKVVKALAFLLQNFEGNSAELNRCIVKLLHRIAWDCKMYGMIFQASIFRIFQRILESKHLEHKDLQKFAVFIIRRFEEVAEKNRKAYMELLFWKNSREANEMVDGYDVQAENKKVSRAVWSEAEEDELRTLFMEHQTNRYSQDLIDWLLENIISEDRTRRGILKKLKEMHLIVNSKNINDEIQKRLPKEWREEEIIELTELWEKAKADDNPIDFVHGGLSIKRPKPKIKEKLLELGLAKDKKELRKKRKKKNDGSPKALSETRSTSSESSNRNSSSNDDVYIVENNGQALTIPNSIPKRKISKKRSKNRAKKQPVIVYSDAQLAGLLKDVIDKNMKESLEWIKESMEETLEDRDEESIEGIPVVPITDYSSAAMDSPSFQRLLRAIGIEPPANEQEAYWRIPSTMLSATIRKRCNLIKNVLDGNYVNEEPIIIEKRNLYSDADDNDNESDDENSRVDLDKIKGMFCQEKLKSKPQLPLGKLLDSNSDDDIKNVINVKTLKKQSISNEMKGIKKKTKINAELKMNSSRIKIMDDSSDSDMEMGVNNSADAESKRNRSDNSDGETPASKKRRIIDSDGGSDNDNVSKIIETKQTRTVISDDED